MSVELNDITSGYSTGLINDNFQLVEDELNNNVLRRAGLSSGEANQMEVGLDMNSNYVYNLPEPVLEHQAARLQDVQNAINGADTANLITFTPYGNISSGNVQGAIQELVDGTGQAVTTSTGTQTLTNALEDRLNEDDRYRFVDDLSGLKAITDMKDGQKAAISFSGRAGDFVFDSSDQSANVASDAQEGVYVAPNSDTTGTSGAWVRQYELLRPEYFGAERDGATDDHGAISAAIAYIQDVLNGGVLVFSVGKYPCSSSILIDKNIKVSLIGEGSTADSKAGTTVLDFSAAADTAHGILVENPGASVGGFTLKGVFIQKDTLSTVNGSIGLRMAGCTNAVVDDVSVHNFDINFQIDETSLLRSGQNSFHNLWVWNSATGGFDIRGSIDSSFRSCFALGNAGGDWCMRLSPGASGSVPNANHFTDCMFIDTGAPTRCLLISAGFWNTFDGCVFENPANENIRCQYQNPDNTGLFAAVFDKCWTNNGTDALRVFGASVHVKNSRLQSVGPRAVFISGATGTTGKERNNTKLTGNLIVAEGAGGPYVVEISRQKGTVVSENTIQGPGDGSGVILTTSDSPDHSVITNNAFYRCTSTPVSNNSTGSVVANNAAEV